MDRQDAIVSLFHAYYGQLIRFAKRNGACSETAQEIVQEVFLKIWKNKALLDQLAAKQPPVRKALMKKITINQCRDVARAEKRQPHTSIILDSTTGALSSKCTVDDSQVLIERLHVLQAISKLRPHFHSPLLLWLAGYSRREMAEILSRPAETVKKQLQRSRTYLKDFI